MSEGSAEKAFFEEEELIQKCLRVILEENRASVSLIQRRYRLGYTRAVVIMRELERRRHVSAPDEKGDRQIIYPATPPAGETKGS